MAGNKAPSVHKGSAAKLVIILPGFTEFCEKYAAEAARFHQQEPAFLLSIGRGKDVRGHLGSDHWRCIAQILCITLMRWI